MLFSEPKIPQSNTVVIPYRTYHFQFQCSSASRKFLNRRILRHAPYRSDVSVLFSEPKIPQSKSSAYATIQKYSFSALQRAENSSIYRYGGDQYCEYAFQCSSASRKFLNRVRLTLRNSRWGVSVLFSEPKIPQSCSY